jgi:hypothetical protein
VTELRRPLVRRLTALSAAAGAALLLAACGGAASGAAPSAPATGTTGTAAPTARAAPAGTAPAAPPAPAAGGGQPAATPPAAAAVRVSANRATRAQLQQAFEAAGIPNAARMAVEVEEYRPYPTTDPGFAKLRQELSKYNIPVAVVDQIVATLTLD